MADSAVPAVEGSTNLLRASIWRISPDTAIAAPAQDQRQRARNPTDQQDLQGIVGNASVEQRAERHVADADEQAEHGQQADAGSGKSETFSSEEYCKDYRGKVIAVPTVPS